MGVPIGDVDRFVTHSLCNCHGAVSHMNQQGYVGIAERMGHESIDITYRYAHLFPTVQRQMAADLDTLQEGGAADVS